MNFIVLSDCTVLVSLYLHTLLQEGFEQVVGSLGQPERLDDVELSKPDGKSFLVEERHEVKDHKFIMRPCLLAQS